MDKAKLTAIDIANYFLVLVDREAGDSITNLKLQKLLYFAQGTSLALFDKPLFDEDLEAWPHGPVAASAYHKFKIFEIFERIVIPFPAEMDFDLYDETTKSIIYKVYSTFGEHAASYLRNLSHEHAAWKEAYACNKKTLDRSLIKCDFKKIFTNNGIQLSEEDKQRIEEAEDEWWMNYDNGEPVEDITDAVNKRIDLFVKDEEKYRSSFVTKR